MTIDRDRCASPALSDWRTKAEDFRRRFWEYQNGRDGKIGRVLLLEADGLLAVALVELAELQRKINQ